jgi:hypothetical protein
MGVRAAVVVGLLLGVASVFADNVGQSVPPPALWATTVTTAATSGATAAAPDGKGGVLVALNLKGGSRIDFGNGVSVTLPWTDSTVVLLDLDAKGRARWARIAGYSARDAMIQRLVADGAGGFWGVGSFTSGTWKDGDKTAETAGPGFMTFLLLHYSADGRTTMSRKVAVGGVGAEVHGLAGGGDGTLFISGFLLGPGSYDFGSGVGIVFDGGTLYSPQVNTGEAFVVKCDANGKALWARSVTWDGDSSGGRGGSVFHAVAATPGGGVAAVGTMYYGGYDLGKAVSLKGESSSGRPMAVQYDASGSAVWARSASTEDQVLRGPGDTSEYKAVVSGPDGTVYAGGSVVSGRNLGFGNGIVVQGRGTRQSQSLLAAYGSDGTARWASLGGGTAGSWIRMLGLDVAGRIVAAMLVSPPGSAELGPGVSLSPSNTGGAVWGNVALAGFDTTAGTALWAEQVTGAQQFSMTYAMAGLADRTIVLAGDVSGNGTFDFGNGQAITISGAPAASSHSFVVAFRGGP